MNERTLKLRLTVDTPTGDPYEEERTARALFDQLKLLGTDEVEPISDSEASLERDPFLTGALLVAIAPTVVSKVLDLVSSFARRNKRVTIRLNIRSEDGSVAEVEVPHTLSPEEAGAWIRTVLNSLRK